VDASNISDQDMQVLAGALECNDTLTHLSAGARAMMQFWVPAFAA
jgi:hypothetical protein